MKTREAERQKTSREPFAYLCSQDPVLLHVWHWQWYIATSRACSFNSQQRSQLRWLQRNSTPSSMLVLLSSWDGAEVAEPAAQERSMRIPLGQKVGEAPKTARELQCRLWEQVAWNGLLDRPLLLQRRLCPLSSPRAAPARCGESTG